MTFPCCLAFLAALIPFAGAQTTPVALSVGIADGALNPRTTVDPSTNDPAIDGADFLVLVYSGDTENLGTYSQKIAYDSSLVAFRSGVGASGLPSGGGGNPGLFAVNETHAADGSGAYLTVTGIGIGNQDGIQPVAVLGFDVVAQSGSGFVLVEDNPTTTAAYADAIPLGISHTSPGVPGPYTIVTQASTSVRHWELFQ